MTDDDIEFIEFKIPLTVGGRKTTIASWDRSKQEGKEAISIATKRTNAQTLLAVFVTTADGHVIEVQAADVGPIRFRPKAVEAKKSA
jgi:hypothetical protein